MKLFKVGLLLLFAISADPSLAQEQKVLIVSSAVSGEIDSVRAAIDLVMDGEIQLVQTLPQDLSDVGMIYVYGRIDPASQLEVIRYLQKGGSAFLDRSGVSDTLSRFIGFTKLYGLLTAVISKGVAGMQGTFAESFYLDDPSYTGTPMPNLSETQSGNNPEFELVLRADGNSELAWTKDLEGYKVMVFMPQVRFYYKPFISYAVCNYFNLCQLEAPKERVADPELVYSPLTSEVILPAAGKITICDMLGRTVISTAPSTDRLKLPADLVKGAYIINWISGDHQASILIQH